MKKAMFLIFTVLSAVNAIGQTWSSDKAHSHFTFSVTHLGVNEVEGTFTDFDAIVRAKKSDFSDAGISFIARSASVTTNNAKRDEHIRSSDFFDVAKFPEISFQGTVVKRITANRYRLNGKLTLLGKTKTVSCELTYRGTAKNPQSNQNVAGFMVTGTLKRSDFGFAEKFPSPLLSDEVVFKASGEFAPAK